MSICRKLVEAGGFGTAFPCDLGLPEGHDGPCSAMEKPASVTARKAWVDSLTPATPVRQPSPDPIYAEPRRAVELMVEPGSISPLPTRGNPRAPIPPWVEPGSEPVAVELPTAEVEWPSLPDTAATLREISSTLVGLMGTVNAIYDDLSALSEGMQAGQISPMQAVDTLTAVLSLLRSS